MTSLLWLIPALPFAAAGIIALLPKSQKALAVPVALAAQFGAAAIALVVLLAALPAHGKPSLVIATVHPWIALGSVQIPIGLMLDPMGAERDQIMDLPLLRASIKSRARFAIRISRITAEIAGQIRMYRVNHMMFSLQ